MRYFKLIVFCELLFFLYNNYHKTNQNFLKLLFLLFKTKFPLNNYENFINKSSFFYVTTNIFFQYFFIFIHLYFYT